MSNYWQSRLGVTLYSQILFSKFSYVENIGLIANRTFFVYVKTNVKSHIPNDLKLILNKANMRKSLRVLIDFRSIWFPFLQKLLDGI